MSQILYKNQHKTLYAVTRRSEDPKSPGASKFKMLYALTLSSTPFLKVREEKPISVLQLLYYFGKNKWYVSEVSLGADNKP